MPGVEANRRQWDGVYAWPDNGEEWSAGWGGSDAQWHSCLRPRLRGLLPAATILEIAPGYGRWSAYLTEFCDRYIGVDLSARGVQACRRRFADVDHAEFHVNDGRSLPMVDSATVDLAFSFDSLVHVEADVMGAYLKELARVLTPDGVAFLHHSNLAACKPVARPLRAALSLAERALRRETPGFDHWRGTTMSAYRLIHLAGQAELACVGQELVNWLGGRLLDCISLVTPRGSRWERPNVVVRNPYFMAAAASSARTAQLYTMSGAHSARPGDDASPPRPGSQLCLQPPETRSGIQPLGSLSSIATASVGPWGLSAVGPLPRRQRWTRGEADCPRR